MGVLLMLATIGVVFVAAVLLIVAVWKKIEWLRKFVLGGATVWIAFYVVLLLGSSLLSEEKMLALNEPKAFCGFYLDCHMHATVSGVRKTKTIGDKTAKGEFYIVTVQIFSDAKRVDLGLLAPKLFVIDENGKAYSRVEDAENPGPPFDKKIPAGGSFEKEVVFDLPADVKGARLDVAEGIGIDKAIEFVLVGDEDSFLHKRSYFKLEPQMQTANLK
jgi:hypothetical protein